MHDMLQGFPAAVNATVTYTLTPDNELEAVMQATSNGATPINMAQHSYFNLDGGASGATVISHVVEMPNACASDRASQHHDQQHMPRQDSFVDMHRISTAVACMVRQTLYYRAGPSWTWLPCSRQAALPARGQRIHPHRRCGVGAGHAL